MQLLVLLPFLLNREIDAKILNHYDQSFFDAALEDGERVVSCSSWWPWHWGRCVTTLEQSLGQARYDLHLKSPLVFFWLEDVDVMALCVSLAGYLIASTRRLRRHMAYLHQVASSTHARDLSWLRVFSGLIAAAALIYVLVSFQLLILHTVWLETETRDYIVFTLLAGGVIYLGVQALLQPALFTDHVRFDRMPSTARTTASSGSGDGNEIEPWPGENRNAAEDRGEAKDRSAHEPSSEEKYRNSPLTQSSKSDIRALIEEYLETSQCYLDPDFSLKALSEALDLGPHELSQVINETIGMNFFDLVNGYRLSEVKRQLCDDARRTILEISIDAGFHSKSSFNAFFKKREGVTPSQWRKSHS